MPFRRKRKTKKSSRMPFSKKQAKAIVKLAHKSQELKMKTDQETDTSVTATSTAHLDLGDFAIAQGTDNDNRIGDNIKIKDVQYQLRVIPGSAGFDTTNGHIYRLIVYQELGNDSLTNVMPNPDEFFPNPETADSKYKILFNKIYLLNPDDTNLKYHKVRIPGNKLSKIYFDDAASTISQNNVRAQLLPVTTTINQLQVVWNARVRYYDA